MTGQKWDLPPGGFTEFFTPERFQEMAEHAEERKAIAAYDRRPFQRLGRFMKIRIAAIGIGAFFVGLALGRLAGFIANLVGWR